ncbi:MAG TPA: TetR/AcrR family transcriptional regulator [Anaeromyxobacteraceae bacterium]|nr:TetR/AcrR family transcriptional regulator [Anaeromyxobacteraceae bacterium]
MNFDSNSVGRLRERLREETSSVILAAAEQVIGEDGVHAARMERIAARAGVSVGTVYNYFTDRASLLQALFDKRAAGMQEKLERALAAVSGRPAQEQVEAILGGMVEHGRSHGAFFAALMAEHMGPSRLRPPSFARAELGRRTADLVTRAIASGEFREDPYGVFADALVSLARLVLMRAIEGKVGPDDVRALAEVYCRGVAR